MASGSRKWHGGASTMPSKSEAQRRLMAAAAHDPAFAKKVGVPQSVAKDFNRADKRRKSLRETIRDAMDRHGKKS